MEIISGEWGKTKIFALPFVTFGATDWLTGVTLALGDVKIAKDGGGYSNIPLGQLDVVSDHVVITLLPADTKFGFAILRIQDQTGPKVFGDTGSILTTTVQAWHQTLFTLIESQRGSHTGEGEIIFWDPINGNDSNSGLIYREPKLTFSYNSPSGVDSLLFANSHQIIKGISSTGGGPTTVSEYIKLDKAYNFLRCDGRDWLVEAIHNESSAIQISAEGCELSGLIAKTKDTGSQDAIGIEADFARIHNVWVDSSQGNGILIDNVSHCKLENFLVQDAALGGSGHAVHILGDEFPAERNIIGAGRIFSNGNGGTADGIRVDGEFCNHNFIDGGASQLLIHDNTGWGINEVNGADETIVVGPTVHIGHNALGQVNLTGVNSTKENTEQWATEAALTAIDTKIDAIPTEKASVVAYPGQFSPPFSMRGQEVEYPKKTSNSIPYNLGTDLTGLTIKFMAKLDLADTDASAVIPLRDITSDVTDLINGLGLAPLTESESNIAIGKYYAEVQALNGATVVQRWFFRLSIIDNVVDGA